PFKGYYLDFVCIDRLLVVELDGGHHNEPIQAEHDGIRDAVLKRAGYQVLRFQNSAVRTDIDAAMETVILALEARPSVEGEESSSGCPPSLGQTPPPVRRFAASTLP